MHRSDRNCFGKSKIRFHPPLNLFLRCRLAHWSRVMTTLNFGYLLKSVAFLSFAVSLLGGSVRAADVTIATSVYTQVTNVTKNYTFTDVDSGANIVVALTMTPYSTNQTETFNLLDGGTRIGIGGGANGDGNWVENSEGMDFNATLISHSSNVDLTSVRFRIAGIGIRSDGANYTWVSSAGVVTSPGSSTENLKSLDINTASLNGTNYSATYRSSTERYQISDFGALSGQSLILNATFQLEARPVFSNAQFVKSPTPRFEATLSGTPGQTYDVYYSTDFVDWIYSGSVTATASGALFTDSNPGFSIRFYQVRPGF